MKRIIAILSVFCLILCAAVSVSAADGLETVFEEDFEEYENGVNVNSTKMPSLFVCDYNSIGDGIIRVNERDGGALTLLSHVFTQIYLDTPAVGGYELSLDVYEAQGNLQSGVFIRAPKTDAAYYESDGYPDTSTCLSGLFITPHGNSIGINVKTYNDGASSTSFIDNNNVTFRLPDGVKFPYNLRVTDDCETISVYVNDTLICTVKMSDPGKTYENHQAKDPCFGSAVLYDAEGSEKGAYKDPLLQSDGSVVGWATRASNMEVDNVRLKAGSAYRTLVLINTIPSKITEKNVEEAAVTVKAARELYDSLTQSEKELVSNAEKLTKAEASVKELLPETTATQTVPDDTADAPTQQVTEQNGTEDGSVSVAESDTGEETEKEAGGDSLAIWILIAVMLAMIGAAAGFIVVKVRK